MLLGNGIRIQGVPSHSFGLLLVSVDNWLEVLQVDITQLIEPEVVERRRDERKVVVREALVAVQYGRGETTEDPAIHRSLLP